MELWSPSESRDGECLFGRKVSARGSAKDRVPDCSPRRSITGAFATTIATSGKRSPTHARSSATAPAPRVTLNANSTTCATLPGNACSLRALSRSRGIPLPSSVSGLNSIGTSGRRTGRSRIVVARAGKGRIAGRGTRVRASSAGEGSACLCIGSSSCSSRPVRRRALPTFSTHARTGGESFGM